MKNEDKDYSFGRTALSLIGQFQKITSPRLVEDCAITFSNVNSDVKERVKEFCLQYHYIPPEIMGKTFIECFKIEQKEVIEIISKYKAHNLEAKDLILINGKLSNIKRRLVFASNLQVLSMNENLYVDREIGKDTDKYIIQVSTGSTSNLMWLQVATAILKEQKILECQNCNSFFVSNHSRDNQKFCSLECSNQYRQSKFKDKKKNK
jgi:hypothetical protein